VSTEPTVDEFERLARTIGHDRMRHFGYTDEQIALTETEPDHVLCDLTEHGWNCLDEDEEPYHPIHAEMDAVAEQVMFVLEHPAAAKVAALSGEVERIESDALAAAERRGYERAITTLRDDEAYRRWHSAQILAGYTDEPFVGTRVRQAAARYLGDVDA
jgi:hypothetical protein